jgi:predicted amidohydrolase YtcJ
LNRIDGHAIIVISKALELAGITNTKGWLAVKSELKMEPTF